MLKKLIDLIRELDRCATQNEKDAKTSSAMSCYRNTAHALGVAGEQRRMIQILKQIIES